MAFRHLIDISSFPVGPKQKLFGFALICVNCPQDKEEKGLLNRLPLSRNLEEEEKGGFNLDFHALVAYVHLSSAAKY